MKLVVMVMAIILKKGFKMKIIKQDSFGRKINSNQLVTENINNKYGALIVDFLNEKFSCPYPGFSFALVPDNYKLFVKEENRLDLKSCSSTDLCTELIHRLNKLS